MARHDGWDATNSANSTILKQLRSLSGSLTKYQRAFWEDARTAIMTEQPVRSTDRERLETELLKLNIVPPGRILQNEELIKRIAKREPIEMHRKEVIVTEQTVADTLSNIDQALKQYEHLFTPPLK
jgi:hypothetical protein